MVSFQGNVLFTHFDEIGTPEMAPMDEEANDQSVHLQGVTNRLNSAYRAPAVPLRSINSGGPDNED